MARSLTNGDLSPHSQSTVHMAGLTWLFTEKYYIFINKVHHRIDEEELQTTTEKTFYRSEQYVQFVQ